MFAGIDGDGTAWHAHPEPWYPQEHGIGDVQPVAVAEATDGPYWGWIDTDGDYPEMIWPRKVLFGMCFPYGPEAEERAGKGRIVRLIIRPETDHG